MKRTNPEAAQVVIEKLGAITPIINHVIDESIIVSRKFFEDRETKVDNYLFPNLVRYEAKTLLELPEYKMKGCEFVSLSNNGLFITYKHENCYYKIRIRKADEDGGLPAQNLSKTLKEFYKNPVLPSMERLENFIAFERLNLVIVWEVDKNYILRDVYLTCPKNEYGEVNFADKIEHAATAIVGNADFDEHVEEIEDIDILPLRKVKIS